MFILKNHSVKANLIITIIVLLGVEKDFRMVQAAAKLVSVLMVCLEHIEILLLVA